MRANRADNVWKNWHSFPDSWRSHYLVSFKKRTDYLFSVFSTSEHLCPKSANPTSQNQMVVPLLWFILQKDSFFWLILVEHFKTLCENDLLQYMTSNTVEVQVITVKILWHYVRQILSRIIVIFGLTFTCTY